MSLTQPIGVIGLSIVLASALSAQTPPTVPVPSQFATAKTAFLASGGAPAGSSHEKQIVSMLYSSVYQALASAHLYQMTATPSQADLSMIVSLGAFTTDVTNGSSFEYNFLRLSVYDTRTHALLWNVDEPLAGAFREKTFQKNIDTTSSKVMADLKTLSSGAIPTDSK